MVLFSAAFFAAALVAAQFTDTEVDPLTATSFPSGFPGDLPSSTGDALTTTVTATATVPASYPTEPSLDTGFYNRNYTVLELDGYRNGDIIDQRRVNTGAYPNTQAWQVIFKSSHANGDSTVGITTIVIPNTMSAQNIVSYQYSEDSADINCSPSYQLLTDPALPMVRDILDQGWALNFPDYLGNSSAFTAGQLSGQLVLDAQRALTRLDPTNDRTWKIALWGYGGGSLATGWAAELRDTYAPDVAISAVAVGGFITQIINWLENVNTSPLSGYIAASLIGMGNEYPEFKQAVLTKIVPGRQNHFLEAGNSCVSDYLLPFENENMYGFFYGSQNIFQNTVVNQTYVDNSLGKTAPTVPMLIYHGVKDEVVPVQDVDKIVKFYCQNNAPVEYQRYNGVNHNAADVSARPNVIAYFSNAFVGSFNPFCGKHGRGGSGSSTTPSVAPFPTLPTYSYGATRLYSVGTPTHIYTAPAYYSLA